MVSRADMNEVYAELARPGSWNGLDYLILVVVYKTRIWLGQIYVQGAHNCPDLIFE